MMSPEKAKASRQKAFAAARAMLAENLTQPQAAARFGSGRHSISQVGLIIKNGTPEEIAIAEAGDVRFDDLLETIRTRTGGELNGKEPVRTREEKDKREFDAAIWARLRDAIDGIRSLPAPADVATIARKNAQRTNHIDRNVLAALTWIEEFSNAWTR